jgi:hypothetical protein
MQHGTVDNFTSIQINKRVTRQDIQDCLAAANLLPVQDAPSSYKIIRDRNLFMLLYPLNQHGRLTNNYLENDQDP